MTTTLLIGTTKGVFLLRSPDREAFEVSGPHCDGWPTNHVIGDPDTGHLWAAGGGSFPGAGVWRSTDGGGTWVLTKLARGEWDAWLEAEPEMAEAWGLSPAPPAPFDGEIDALWSLARTGGTLYAGAKPATLLESRDGGTTWARVNGLTDHPSRDTWQPGGAGLTLHSIVTDPGRPKALWVGISAAGIFATEDGGASWDRRNRLSNASVPDHPPHPGHTETHETGHCVHNIIRAPGDGDLLYQQNHHGVFRSRDGGRNWDDISAGLPSTFGFPIAVHPRDPDCIWVLPLNGDSVGRFPPEASAAVWHSADGGETWKAERDGLPGKNCFFTVLRQAMATDREEPAGVYFGTNSGSVFARTGQDPEWREIARHLPTVLSVEVL